MTICAAACSLGIAIPNSINQDIKRISSLSFRLLATAIIAVLSYKIYKKVKQSNTSIPAEPTQSTITRAAQEMRKRNEKNILRLTVCIIACLLATNLPLAFHLGFSSSGKLCKSFAVTIMHNVAMLNPACDAISFFFFEKRRQSRAVKVGDCKMTART